MPECAPAHEWQWTMNDHLRMHTGIVNSEQQGASLFKLETGGMNHWKRSKISVFTLVFCFHWCWSAPEPINTRLLQSYLTRIHPGVKTFPIVQKSRLLVTASSVLISWVGFYTYPVVGCHFKHQTKDLKLQYFVCEQVILMELLVIAHQCSTLTHKIVLLTNPKSCWQCWPFGNKSQRIPNRGSNSISCAAQSTFRWRV